MILVHLEQIPTGIVTFVKATFVLVTFEHIRNISVLEQIPTVTVTFVHATFVLVTFVHTSNTSAVADPILTKL